MPTGPSDPAPPPPRPRLAHFELAPGEGLDQPLRLAWVDAVESLAVRIVAAGGSEADTAVNFGIAVREAVMNALRHAARPGQAGVAVSFRVSAGPTLVVTVRDRGCGFDPNALPDPRSPENLGRGSGRGVFYMREFADEVSFVFPRRGGTVTRLKKKLALGDEQRPLDPGLEEWLGPLPRSSSEGP